jgi:hypothetical protein
MAVQGSFSRAKGALLQDDNYGMGNFILSYAKSKGPCEVDKDHEHIEAFSR